MPNNKPAAKRYLQSEKRRLRNRTQLVSARNVMKRLLKVSSASEAEALLPMIVSRLDRLAKKKIIHKNKAARYKSRLSAAVKAMNS